MVRVDDDEHWIKFSIIRLRSSSFHVVASMNWLSSSVKPTLWSKNRSCGLTQLSQRTRLFVIEECG